MLIRKTGKFKVILALALLFMLVFSTAQAAQMDQGTVYAVLNRMEGNWYNHNGSLVLSIYDGYINDCKVVAGYDFAGGKSDASGVFTILESAGYRNLRIEWHIHNDGQDKMFFSGQALHRR